mmetsp:Transcript_103832/g.318009  ORF Transcript_103832/g.318009 Transcript_103832/m.318009 type:complete len:201 (-) Transcript_103832:867-1469(-)
MGAHAAFEHARDAARAVVDNGKNCARPSDQRCWRPLGSGSQPETRHSTTSSRLSLVPITWRRRVQLGGHARVLPLEGVEHGLLPTVASSLVVFVVPECEAPPRVDSRVVLLSPAVAKRLVLRGGGAVGNKRGAERRTREVIEVHEARRLRVIGAMPVAGHLCARAPRLVSPARGGLHAIIRRRTSAWQRVPDGLVPVIWV